jgi:hypothetical protein
LVAYGAKKVAIARPLEAQGAKASMAKTLSLEEQGAEISAITVITIRSLWSQAKGSYCHYHWETKEPSQGWPLLL